MDLSTLRDTCEAAASKAEQWMLSHLQSVDLSSEDLADPVRYYKWPLTLIARKKKREARKLFRAILKRCLDENGDLVSKRSGFHEEFHNYANTWLIRASILLDEEDSTDLLLSYVRNNQNLLTGGVKTQGAASSEYTEDPLSTAFLGLAACDLKLKDVASLSVRFLSDCCNRQSGDGFFWLRTGADGSVIKIIPDGADPATYVIDLGIEEQSYYFFGAVCLFLASYTAAFGENEDVDKLTRRMLAVLSNLDADTLGTIWAAKVAPGAVALYKATGNDRFLDIAHPVIHAVIDGQTEQGYWLKNGEPWLTVSAEQCYWLTTISRQL